MQNLSISCALVCLIILGSAALIGAFGVCQRQISAILVTGVMYLLAGKHSPWCDLNDIQLTALLSYFSSFCTVHSHDNSFQTAKGKTNARQWLWWNCGWFGCCSRFSTNGTEFTWSADFLYVMELRFGLGWGCIVCISVALLDISIENNEVHAAVPPFDVNKENIGKLNSCYIICTGLRSYNLQCFHCYSFIVLCALVADRIKEMERKTNSWTNFF